MEVLKPNRQLGYSKISIYSSIEFDKEFNEKFVLNFLRSEYSENAVGKQQKKTGYLPFPFVTERLREVDIQTIHEDFSLVIIEIFKGYESQWNKFESNLALFNFDLNEAKKTIQKFKIEYPCFLLNIDEFDSNSKLVHPLYHDTGFIYDYFYFLIFKTSQQKLMTLEMGLD